jgi:hypothetical protein
MSNRSSILARLRRWNLRAGRYVVGLFAAAYLSAGLAPCIALAVGAPAPPDEQRQAAPRHHAEHAGHGRHEDAADAASQGHGAHGGSPAAHDGHLTPAEKRGAHCPHCPPGIDGAPAPHGADHVSCSTLDDLSNAAQAHAAETPQPAPLAVAPTVVLPPPWTSPGGSPQPPAPPIPAVPLNIRHCVLLI